MCPHPRRRIEQPAECLKIPALAAHRRAELAKKSMKPDRAHSHENLGPPVRAAVTPIDPRRVTKGHEVIRERGRVFLRRRGDRDQFPIAGQMTIARYVCEHANQARAELERLMREADEGLAENELLLLQRSGLSPAVWSEHAVIRGHAEPPSVRQRYRPDRSYAARARAPMRSNRPESALV